MSHPVVCKLPHHLLPTIQQSPSHQTSPQPVSPQLQQKQPQQQQEELQDVSSTREITETFVDPSEVHQSSTTPAITTIEICDNNNSGTSDCSVKEDSPLFRPHEKDDSSGSSSGSSSGNLSGSSPKLKDDVYAEVEESCLLGIDCNEKTTIGLVLKVMADTSIRLDGDG